MTSINQECPISAEKLEEKWEGLYDEFNDNPAANKEFEENHQLLLRLQRAISWLDGSQRVERGAGGKDLSAQFIFLWIGFNAIYAKNFYEFPDGKPRECDEAVKEYFNNILGSEDAKTRIYNIIKNNISSEINDLIKLGIFLQSKFFKNYYKNEKREKWLKPILSKPKSQIKITKQNTRKTLDRVFEYLCILRNQLMHGGSTWGSRLNKKQLSLGIKIMQCLLPAFIEMEKSDNNNSPSDKKELKGKGSFLLCADSWLSRAQQMEKGVKSTDEEIDTQFIFLWIAFNAIYSRDEEKNLPQKKQIEEYFQKLLKCNGAKDTICNVIDSNKLRGKIESLERETLIPFPGWNIEFTEDILCFIFKHLCDLRDQLVHGFESWDCKLKKSQLSDYTKIMHHLLPVFIDIMLKIPEKEWKQWGKIWYPRVLGVGIKGKPFEEENHFNPEKIKGIFGLK